MRHDHLKAIYSLIYQVVNKSDDSEEQKNNDWIFFPKPSLDIHTVQSFIRLAGPLLIKPYEKFSRFLSLFWVSVFMQKNNMIQSFHQKVYVTKESCNLIGCMFLQLALKNKNFPSYGICTVR